MSGDVARGSLAAADAVELAELLEFVDDWLAGDDGTLRAGFGRFGLGLYSLEELRADLARFAFLLGGDADRFISGAP